MPPIAAARSGQNIRRTCKLMSDISTSPTAATKAPSSAAACGSGKNVQAVSHPKNSKLYKTELCRTWMDCGRCNYGDKCQYAHGEEERRPVSRHPKYKTEFCQPFHQVGYCPYGPRCNFIHNEEQPHSSSLPALRNQINCNENGQASGSTDNNDINGTAATAATARTTATATLTFGVWQPYCNSASDSPAPSSTGSSTESSIGSGSPNLDFDENTSSVVATANAWGTFGAKFNSNVYHFNWPSSAAAAAIATTARATPLIAEPLRDSAALVNDFLELTVEEKKKNKAIITKTVSESAVTCASSGRLPVFAQLSNPSSAL